MTWRLGEQGNTTYLGDTSQWGLVGDELISYLAELGNFFVVEGVHPSLGVVCIIFGLPDTFPGDLFGEI